LVGSSAQLHTAVHEPSECLCIGDGARSPDNEAGKVPARKVRPGPSFALEQG